MEKKIIKSNDTIKFYHVDPVKGDLHYFVKEKGETYEVKIPMEEIHISIQKGGNSKTGKEWLLNTVPGESPIKVDGVAITNILGSCRGCCDGCEKHCYAINGARQHHNAVLPSTIKNLILYRKDPDRFYTEIDASLSAWKAVEGDEKVFRWHASGEIEDYAYLELMMRLAENHPEINFYSYTKRFEMIERYLDEHNGEFPTNFVWNLSVWKDNLEKSGFNPAYLNKVQLFEYKDDITKEEYNSHFHCPGVIHTGKKRGKLNHNTDCKTCTLCWLGRCKGKTIYVYNH